MTFWIREYNSKQFTGKMKSNPKIGWSAENYLAALFGMYRTRAGLSLPDLASNHDYSKGSSFWVEVKSSKGKGLIYPSQMYADVAIERVAREGAKKSNSIGQSSIEFPIRSDFTERTLFAFVNNQTKIKTRPKNRQDTTALAWGNIYVLPIELVRRFYLTEILRKRRNDIIGDNDEARLLEIQKAMNIIRKGIQEGTPSHEITQLLLNEYASGNLGIDPAYFSSKRDKKSVPNRFENLRHSLIERLMDDNAEAWERLNLPAKIGYPETSLNDFYSEQTQGPENTLVRILSPRRWITDRLSVSIRANRKKVETINLVRRIFGVMFPDDYGTPQPQDPQQLNSLQENHPSASASAGNNEFADYLVRELLIKGQTSVDIDRTSRWELTFEEAKGFVLEASRLLANAQDPGIKRLDEILFQHHNGALT